MTRSSFAGPAIGRRGLLGAGAAGLSLLAIGAKGARAATTTTVNVECDAGLNELPFRWNTAALESKFSLAPNLVSLPFVGQYEKLVTDLTSRSTAYDVMVFPPYFMGDFQSLGFLKELDPFFHLLEPKLADYLPVYRDPVIKRNGKTYALMYDGDLLQVTYRSDLFDDPGEKAAFEKKYKQELVVPATWDDFMKVAEFFTRPPKLYGTAFYAARGFCYAWFVNIFAGLGGHWFDAKMKPGINSEAGVKALSLLVEMKKFAPPNILQIDYPTLNAVFLDGSTAMVVQWDDLAPKCEDPRVSKIIGKAAFAPCPQRSYMPYSRVMAVSAFSPRPEEAYKLASYMQQPEVMITYVYDPECGEDPYRVSALDPKAVKNHLGKPTMSLQAATSYVDAIRAGLKAGYPELSIPGAPRYIDILDLYVNQALAGTLSPKAALDACASNWQGITEAEGTKRIGAAYAAWVDSFHKVGITY